jgi:hypothetical protein
MPEICARRPVIPLLFVLVMEGLNAMLKLADDKRLLRVLHPRIKERAFMYADDVAIFSLPGAARPCAHKSYSGDLRGGLGS